MTVYLILFATLIAGLAAGVVIGVHFTARSEAKRRAAWPIVGPVALDLADARNVLDRLCEALNERDSKRLEFTPAADALYSLLELAGIDPTRLPAVTGTLQWLSEYADLHRAGATDMAVALPDASAEPAQPAVRPEENGPEGSDPFDRAADELARLLQLLNHTGYDRAWQEDARRAWSLLDAAKELLIQRGYRH